MFKRTLMALALAATVAAPAATIHAAAPCNFKLGFASLAGMIPDQIGTCVNNEYFNPQNGDEEQNTTGGLLVWRKADNWTAFTNGYDTWINGPQGLQERLNTDRFSWEPAAPPPAPSPAPSAAPSSAPATTGLSAADIASVQVPNGAPPMAWLTQAQQLACVHLQQDFNKAASGGIVAMQDDSVSCPYMYYWNHLIG